MFSQTYLAILDLKSSPVDDNDDNDDVLNGNSETF